MWHIKIICVKHSKKILWICSPLFLFKAPRKKLIKVVFYKSGILPINPNAVTGDITVIYQCRVNEIGKMIKAEGPQIETAVTAVIFKMKQSQRSIEFENGRVWLRRQGFSDLFLLVGKSKIKLVTLE
jgi:hypothetical protein